MTLMYKIDMWYINDIHVVCSGYFMNAARKCLTQAVYRCLSDDYKLVHIHPFSSFNEIVPPEFCVYHELVYTSRGISIIA